MAESHEHSRSAEGPPHPLVIGMYVRTSTRQQIGNARSEWQLDLVSYLQGLGFGVRLYKEWGVPGTTLNARPQANSMLGDLQGGKLQGIFVAEVSRLTRDARGLDAAFIGHLLRVHAEGRLITYGRIWDLRRSRDWELYRSLAIHAGWERQTVRDTAYSGYIMTAARQPVFRGKVKVGYKRVPFPNKVERTSALARTPTTLEKDHGQADVMAALALEFERQPTLPEVVRALNASRVQRPYSTARGVAAGRWHSRDLENILLDPVYAGEWRLLNRYVVSDVWYAFKRDGFDPADISHSVPHLAWFPAADAIRWRTKLLSSVPGTSRRPHHKHLLLGILSCPECGTPFIKGAATDTAGIMYRCRGVERSHTSGRERSVSERTAFKALRDILPNILATSSYLLGSMVQDKVDPFVADLHAQLVAAEERARFIREHWLMDVESPPHWLQRETELLANVRIQLERELREIEERTAIRNRAIHALEGSIENLLSAFDRLTAEEQAAIWRTLVTNVKITVTKARGKNCRAWVREWAPADDPIAIQYCAGG